MTCDRCGGAAPDTNTITVEINHTIPVRTIRVCRACTPAAVHDWLEAFHHVVAA